MPSHDCIDDRPCQVTGPPQRAAHVLLVGPAVEQSHRHELTIGNLTDRAPAETVEVVGRHCEQHPFAFGRYLDELREHIGAGSTAPRFDGVLVRPPEIVLDIRGVVVQRRVAGKAQQLSFDGDQVAHVVAHRPARAIGG